MRFWLLAAGACLLSVSSPGFADDLPFEAVEIRAEGPVWGEVAVAPLIRPGEPALMLLHRDEGRQWLSIYNPATEGGWLRPLLRHVRLEADDLFYDIVETGKAGTALLALMTPREIRLIDPASGVEIARLALSHLYRGEANPEFGRLDFARDVDGDGRDDLLIPDFDGLHLLMQQPDGSFAAPMNLAFRPEMRLFRSENSVPSYHGFPMELADIDDDKERDIVFLRGLSLVWFRNLGAGAGFDPVPRETATGLRAVGNRWVDQLDADRRRASDADFVETRIVDIEDFDGDGTPDLLTQTESVRGTFDRDVRYGLHFGRRRDGGLGYDADAGTGVSLDGFVARRETVDLDGDGQRDFVTASVDIGLGKVIGALFSGSTSVALSFFRLGEDGRYPERASLERKTRVDFGFSSGVVEVPVFLTADLSGDGRRDLVLAEARGKLAVYRGVAARRLFAEQHANFAISLPRDGNLVEPADIDGDGRADLVIRFDPRGRDGLDARERIILLLSRRI